MPIFATLVSFNVPGYQPQGGLIVDAAGNLFGTTDWVNGSGGFLPVTYFGTVYEIARTGGGYASTPTTRSSFVDGNWVMNPDQTYSFVPLPSPLHFPTGGLIADVAGNLFGTTYYGGVSDDGGVFEIADTGGAPATLFSFNNSNAIGGLTVDGAGNLFGVTSASGNGSYGTVVEIAKTAAGYASAPATLITFNGANGANPSGGLIADAAGNLFGTT
jgi:uncharacterized repeat protein (TIGR03803 family)